MVVRPTFLEPSRGCPPTPTGSLEAPCNRSAPNYTASSLYFGTACRQCHCHLIPWVPLRQAAPSSTHSVPCQRGSRGLTCCTPSSSSHAFKLDTGPRTRGTQNMQTGATCLLSSSSLSFNFYLFQRRDESKELLILEVWVQGSGHSSWRAAGCADGNLLAPCRPCSAHG